MRNLFLTLALVAATAVSAQELSTNIQETYHSMSGLADEFHVWKVTNIEPTSEAWDEMDWDFPKMEFEPMASYGEHAMHTWTEAGVYVIFSSLNEEPMGERTFFVINENYVNFVKEKIDGLQVQDTYIRSDVQWVSNPNADMVVMVR
jgi:hypothetical protein